MIEQEDQNKTMNKFKTFKTVEILPTDEEGVKIQHSTLSADSSLEGYNMSDTLFTFKNRFMSSIVHILRVWMGHNFVIKNAKNYDSIADIGCGFGEIANLLYSTGFKANYYCLDFDYSKLKAIVGKKPKKFNKIAIRNDMSKAQLPFPDRSLDAVISIESLEHIPKKNGILLLKEI